MRTDRSQGRPGGYNPRTYGDPDEPDRRAKALQSRKEKFAALNRFVTKAGGWVTSIPGDYLVTIECTEGSSLPEKLQDLGYRLREVDRRERMISNATTEEIVDLCHNKTRTLSHAGLVPVIVYSFEL
ncbi:hypothetical protein [Bradyrhizobium sp. SZCCHNR1098]|uniref:hypothetical protein n=1 Tax=Bradyrhizobium sp. SZCCHNR1098 TaxID=3057370 RepID=UPI002916EA8E|nr:hypothetical protein [Bradyrhizobium sp. SZCCHNR1098]